MIGQIINQGFVILSVLIAFMAWKHNPSYKWVAMALVADFCIFVGIDTLWLDTAILDISQTEVQMMKYYIYLSFFFIYLICGSVYLSILSVFAVVYHLTNPNIGEQPYLIVMTFYCILQLSGAYIGVFYEPIRKRFSHWRWYHNSHSGHSS